MDHAHLIAETRAERDLAGEPQRPERGHGDQAGQDERVLEGDQGEGEGFGHIGFSAVSASTRLNVSQPIALPPDVAESPRGS